ncbi:MAG: CopG family transcriptional regulator [Candidatus Rokuibacteriota bacterium]|nr:MAG: CopG family transcriptional regulator [Candidatus Rokubacteria bacterium]
MKLAKTTVYLAEGDYRRLKAIARGQKRTTAELVRDAIADYTRRHGGRTKPRSLGIGRSGRGDLSERAEELLTGMGRRR